MTLPAADDYSARMTTQTVLAAIAADRARLDAALAARGLRVDTVSVTPDGWTAKDTIAHMIHWVGQIAFGLGAPLTPPAYVTSASGRPTGEEWNALAVSYYRQSPYLEVRATLDEVMDGLVERIEPLSDDAMNATDSLPWAGSRPLWNKIGTETFLHWPNHLLDLERAAASP